MDCAEAKLRIESYVADQLSAGEKAALESHLADCAECRLDGELTRASKSAPTTSSLPPAAPQEAAPRPSAGEWTIESIFGSGTGSRSGSASPSTPASALPRDPGFESGSGYTAPPESGPPAEPEVPLPEALKGPESVPEAAPAGSLEDAAANGVPGWQFEAADAKEAATPPEGSLFFAEEALSRTGTPAKAKSSLLRVVMWGAGGVVGLALLGISIWFALTLKPPTPHDAAMHPAPASDTHVPPAIDPSTDAGAGETAEIGARPTGEAGVAPVPEHASVAPVETPAAAAPHAPHAGRETAPLVAETSPPKQADPAPPRQAGSAPRHPVETAPPVPAERPLWEPAIREEASVPPPAASPPQARPPAASSDDPPPASTPPPRPKSPPPTNTAQETTPAPPAPDPIQRPIDRLHLATVGAEQNADLPGLRKLRETWRVFLRTSVGPDRARAKRELGDCLWAIQILTTRTSDQKAALVAYRDYLLNAPAGGADARTVSRMRQLEDALAEGR